MSQTNPALPQGYESLAPFVEFWAAATTAGRARCRDLSDEAGRNAFYEAIAPLAGPALDLLDQKSLADFDEGEQNLMKLLLSFGHVAMAVELQRDQEADHARWRHFMRITRSPGDM